MSEETQVEQQEQPQQQQDTKAEAPSDNMFTKDQVQELIASEVGGLKNKLNEVLSEKKKLKEQAEEDAIKKEGDLEKLREFYEEREAKREQEHKEWKAQTKAEKHNNVKLSVVNDLVGDFIDSTTASALLKGLIEVNDDGQIYRDFSGNIVADNASEFEQWLKQSPHVKHMLRGTRATGGGAEGNRSSSGAGTKTYTQEQWSKLDPASKLEIAKKLADSGESLSNIITD